MQRGGDLSTLSNAYLKALITERGYSHDGLLTREELVARAEEAATTPDLPPLEGDEDGTDSEDSEAEKVEEAEALARRLVLQELRAIVAVRDAAACSVGDVLKLVRARAPEEYRIVGKCWIRDRLQETMEAEDEEEGDRAQYVWDIESLSLCGERDLGVPSSAGVQRIVTCYGCIDQPISLSCRMYNSSQRSGSPAHTD